ncbi:MAG: hypothetical protein KME03_04040 [Aphanocapsa lilacina HA4352-LM1]|nr:hypothetical protein [Aphanocapsa lilacina HA4352-LM1]
MLLNTGGSFSRARSFGVGFSPLSVALGDLDGDSDLDLATSNNRLDTVTVLRNITPNPAPPAPALSAPR